MSGDESPDRPLRPFWIGDSPDAMKRVRSNNRPLRQSPYEVIATVVCMDAPGATDGRLLANVWRDPVRETLHWDSVEQSHTRPLDAGQQPDDVSLPCTCGVRHPISLVKVLEKIRWARPTPRRKRRMTTSELRPG